MQAHMMRTRAEEVLAAWTAQDVDRVLDCYTTDLVYTDPNTNGAVHGRDAMRKYLERLFARWTMTWALREERPFADGTGTHVLWRGTFRRASGGPTTTIDGMDLVLLEGDRIARNDVVFDRTLLPQTDIDPRELHRFALRGWTTHDAMWFRAAVEALGVEAANELNLRAVRDAAALEAKRVIAVLGIERVDSIQTLERFLSAARDMLVGDLLRSEWIFEPPSTMRIRVRDCFAQRGVSKLDVLDLYECGIYERVWGWLDALQIGHGEAPRACTARNGSCERVVTLTFP